MNDETHIGLVATAGDGTDAATAATNVDAPVPAARLAAVTVPADVLARVHDLYVGGRNLDALEVALTVGPLDRWCGAEARIMAGRLAGNLGAARLARVLHLRAYRAEPAHRLARYYYARAIIERRGPYETWQFMTRCGAPDGRDPEVLADWLAFEAMIAAMLRDFATAERGIGRALEIAPDRAWIHIERASILNQQDKPADALASAMRALALSPLYRPALQFAAEMLIMMDRDAEAIALLDDAAARTQSSAIVGHLAALVGEAGDKPRARALWERVVELSPMADKDYLKFLSARRCDAAYACGDYAAAAELARQAGKGFHAKIAERLSADLTGKERVELKVPFVRQDHMTCGPATLAALARFWGKAVEHPEVVEEICYDGTPAHSERAWAERNGFVCREFRATWASAVALIDRGVPFTLTTTETTSAHLQAVIGYDARRHTLLLRDPSTKHEGEVQADGLVEVYKSTGPRAMAMVPADRAELFDGLDLPEVGLYHLFYRVQTGLVAHRREAALAAYGEMIELDKRERPGIGAKPQAAEGEEAAAPAPEDAPGRLVCWARRSIGAYDSDHAEQLAATEALIAQFPDDPVLQLGKLGLLRDLSRRSEILETLAAAAAAPKADLVFSFQYANELANDPRELPRATRMLRRYVRYRGGDAIGYGALASLLWQAREREEALALYRVATCLNDKDDRLAVMYFSAARYFGKAADAIALVADRFARFGGRSAVPAITLFRALAAVDRTPEAFAALDKGLKKRPDDADLMLFMADQCARYGRTARSVELLARAEGKAHPTALRRVRATVATYRGELAAALADWEAVLKADPLALDANENVVQLIAETRGREAAVAHLRAVCARFEHNYPLHQLLLGWLRQEDAGAYEQAVRRLLESRPTDAWLLRELALALVQTGRAAEAIAPAEESLRLEPLHTAAHGVLARVYEVAGLTAQARHACREAIRLSVDNETAMATLFDLAATRDERREVLAFICAELVRQVTAGEGLLAYRVLARGTLDGEEILRTLGEALASRPDLWHAWAAKARQLADMGRLDEAEAVAKEAADRFPLLAKMWLDLAVIRGQKGDTLGEEETLKTALELAPGWGPAVRQLADVHNRRGEFAEARRVLEGALAFAPLDAANHGYMAEACWKLDDRDRAIEAIRTAVTLQPSYDWAWRMLRYWSAEAGRPGLAAELAREVAGRRAGEAASWLTLAQMLDGPETLDERLAALDKAVALEPLNVDGHDARANVLARAGRIADADAACRPAAFGEAVPVRLRGRAAWVVSIAGDLATACDRMREVLAEDPQYAWGWSMLAEWERDRGRNAEFAEAAEQLTETAPLAPGAWGLLGDAHERLDQAGKAMAAYRRALELDPTYAFAAYGLFDLKLAGGAVDEAARVLDAVLPHERGSLTQSRRVQLACRQDLQDEAAAAMGDLCRAPDLDRTPLKIALGAMASVGWAEDADRAMWHVVVEPAERPGLARFFGGEMALADAGHVFQARVDRLREEAVAPDGKLPENVRMLAVGYVEALWVDLRRTALDAFLRQNAGWVRDDVLIWGTVGAALIDTWQPRRALAWMADWRTRADVGGWIVANIAEAHLALGDIAAARAVTLAGLQLPADHCRDALVLWQALDEAWTGQTASARSRLDGVSREAQPQQRQFVYDVTAAMCAAADGRATVSIDRARGAMEAAAAGYKEFGQQPTMRRVFGMGVQAIARRGGVVARLWAWRWRVRLMFARNAKTK